MALKEGFKQAVAAKEKIRVRVMLKDSMLIDPTLTSFEEMLVYAEERMIPFYDKHNGEVLFEDSANWTEQYLDKQMVAMISNFSVERISLLRKMVPIICGKRNIPDGTEKTNNDDLHKRNGFSGNSVSDKAVISKREIGTGLIIVGGVAFVAGVVIPKTILTVAGIGTIAIGTGLVLKEKKGS